MERSAPLEVDITEMPHGGAALGRTQEGQVAFVDDALPGEKVMAQTLSRRARFLRGRAVEVLTPSPQRVVPRCPYVPECGGCQWQHAAYEAQLQYKVDLLATALRRAEVTAPRPDLVPADDPWRYRIRGEFHVIPSGNGHQLGFNRRRSYDRVPVADCLIHHPTITDALPGICRALDETGAGRVQALRLTASPARRELLWQARGAQAPDGLQAALERHLPDYLLHQDSLTLEYQGDRVDGRDGAVIFRIDSDTFVQVNHALAHGLYRRALDYIGAAPGRMVEGYAGFGAVSVFAATRVDTASRPSRVTLIESSRPAAIMGRLHLRLHEVEQVAEYRHGRMEERLGEIAAGEVDTLVVDPPRAGCGPIVVAEVLRLRPARLVYVSCDPATLARDLAQLAAGGFRVEAQTLVDMFPQTYHVETVSLLLAGGPGSRV